MSSRTVRRPPSLSLSDGFDLLILDMALPGREGFRVLQRLRAEGRRMPVVVLTGTARAARRRAVPRRRRRRLHDQAVPLRGAAGADPSPAARPADRRGHRARRRRGASRRARPSSHGRWPGDRSDGPRVRPARAADAPPRPGAHVDPRSCPTSGATPPSRGPTSSTSTSGRCARSSAADVIESVRGIGYCMRDSPSVDAAAEPEPAP